MIVYDFDQSVETRALIRVLTLIRPQTQVLAERPDKADSYAAAGIWGERLREAGADPVARVRAWRRSAGENARWRLLALWPRQAGSEPAMGTTWIRSVLDLATLPE